MPAAGSITDKGVQQPVERIYLKLRLLHTYRILHSQSSTMAKLLELPIELRSIILRYIIDIDEIKICSHNTCCYHESPPSIIRMVNFHLTSPLLVCRAITAELAGFDAPKKVDLRLCAFSIVIGCLEKLSSSAKSRIRSVRFHAIVMWPENEAREEESRWIIRSRFEKHFGREVSMTVLGDAIVLRNHTWIENLMQELEA